MDADSPWDWLNFRYENDDLARFALVLDAVEDAVSRLHSNNISDVRLALVIADYLADVLLARRVDRVISLSERGFPWEAREQFDSKARGLLRQGFNRRVEVAARPYDARLSFGLGEPILERTEAETLRVAHTYRNDVYHEDRHNPRTLPVVATAALHVVVRAWMNSLPSNIGSSAGAEGPLMRRLEEKGYVSPEWGVGRMLSLHAGAVAVAGWLQREVPVNLREQRRALAVDVEARVQWAAAMIEWLSGRAGPGREHIEPALLWNDFWRQHGADPELVALDTRRRTTLERFLDVGDDGQQRDRREVESSERAYAKHLHDLHVRHKPAVSMSALPGLKRRGSGLLQARDTGALLARYRTLDTELRVFEETLAEVARSWDDFVESEVDRLRDK